MQSDDLHLEIWFHEAKKKKTGEESGWHYLFTYYHTIWTKSHEDKFL